MKRPSIWYASQNRQVATNVISAPHWQSARKRVALDCLQFIFLAHECVDLQRAGLCGHSLLHELRLTSSRAWQSPASHRTRQDLYFSDIIALQDHDPTLTAGSRPFALTYTSVQQHEQPSTNIAAEAAHGGHLVQ